MQYPQQSRGAFTVSKRSFAGYITFSREFWANANDAMPVPSGVIIEK